MELDFTMLKATNEVFKRLNILRRWSSFVSANKYNELCKQALNCIIAYILASYSEEENIPVKWENFPKIALYRAFEKAYVNFDTPEYILNEICEIGDIPRNAFEEATKTIISRQAGEDFANFVCEGNGTYESRIYRAATKIATLLELIDISNSGTSQEYQIKSQDIYNDLESYYDLPGVREVSNICNPIFNILRTISNLRNRVRWSTYAYTIECSVLGHLFDTAVFAYFMSLEQNPGDEALATKMFFMGIFHDVAETWTTDIPSPIKDMIPRFRLATETYEMQKLEMELYSKVPPFIAVKLKEAMFEDEANIQYKKLLKGADYLSADSECWRQYVAGSRDDYFLDAIQRRLKQILSEQVLITPACLELFGYFMECLEKISV